MKRVSFSGLRTRLMFLAFLTIVPVVGLVVYSDWQERQQMTIVVSGLALVAAFVATWFGSDLVFLRNLNALVRVTRRLAEGDLSARLALVYDDGEIGQLARDFDEMARSIEQREEERSKAASALRESEERYRDLFENANDLIQCVTPDGRFVYTNRAWRETLGYSEAEVADLIMFNVLAPNCPEHCGEIFQRVMAGEKIERVEAEFVSKDGRQIVVEGSISCGFQNGKPVSTRGIFRDVTARKLAEQAQRESEERYRTLFERVPVGLYRTTPAGKILGANPALAKILGFPDARALCQANAIDLYVDPNDRIRQQELLQRGKDVVDFDMQLRRCDGGMIWARDNMRAVRDDDGQVLYHEGSLEDITVRKQAEQQLTYMGMHDLLTGLYNRVYFEEASRRLVRSRRFPVSIIMADVDDLKMVNDTFGHAAGDELLKQVAQALRSSFRPDDIVARLGGDEFAVLLPDIDARRANEALERIRRNVQESAAPAGLAVGLSLGAATAERSDLFTQAMKRADDQMYEDKLAHKKIYLETV